MIAVGSLVRLKGDKDIGIVVRVAELGLEEWACSASRFFVVSWFDLLPRTFTYCKDSLVEVK